jgi:phosphatidylserine/phosphatidylglycerophosphate/cardiolipin synthase-like enzyme
VIAVGRLAGIDSSGRSNQSDDALLAMIGAARATVRLSQQDLGPPKAAGITLNAWPEPLFAKLGSVMARGVDVYIVLSNSGAIAGGLTATTAAYSNGWTMQDVARRIRDYLAQHPQPGLPGGAALDALLCQKLHLAPLRSSDEDAFPDGTPMPNHAKLAMVDDRAFFVGSQNLYNAGLTEFGFITDDPARGAELRDQYWARLWSYSSRAAVSGSEAAQCALR